MSDDKERTLEEEFSKSWDGIERFFRNLFETYGMTWLESILRLIADLRLYGYDKRLRAGQSMSTFILSRSEKHGLRKDQASLWIIVLTDGGMSFGYYEPPNTSVEKYSEKIEITHELEELLFQLIHQPID